MPEHGASIWWNGRLVPYETALTHVMSDTALRGLNAFEGLRAYALDCGMAYGIPGLDQHLARLERSTWRLGFRTEGLSQRMREAVVAVLSHADKPASDLYLRPTVYATDGAYEPNSADISTEEFVSWREEPSRSPRRVNCATSTWRHTPPDSFPSDAKVGASYTAFHLARIDVKRRGFEEAILLNEVANITESPGGSVFAFFDDLLVTPPVCEGILPSVTRRIVLDHLCPLLGVEVEERPIAPDEMYTAAEAFLAGTVDEISSISAINGHPIGQLGIRTPRTDQLSEAYQELCRGTILQHSQVLTVVLTKA